MIKQKRLFELVAIGVLLLLLSKGLTGWRPFEDSYISFRYAAQAATGNGLVFNPNEKVEGYTNFLWTIMLAGVGVVSVEFIPTAAVTLELILAFLTALILMHWTGRWWPALILFIFPGYIDNLGTGIEVPLVGFLATLAAFLLFEKRKPYAGSLVLGLLFLARPDGGLIAVLFFSIAWLINARQPEQSFAFSWPAVFPWVSILGVHELFRLIYYGDPLPNTFYAKAGINLVSDIAIGFNSILAYAQRGGSAFFILLLLGLLLRWRDRNSLGLLLSIAAFTCYTVIVGGPSGNPARFVAPLIPLLVASWAIPTRADLRSKSSFIKTSTVACLIVMVGFIHLYSKRHNTPWQDQTLAVDSFELVSRAVRFLPTGSTIVFQALGKVGWENRHLILIDPFGITNREVAKNGENHPEVPFQGHRKWMTADQFFKILPDFFVPFSVGGLVIGDCPDSLVIKVSPGGPDAVIMNDSRFSQFYQPMLLKSENLGCCLAFAK